MLELVVPPGIGDISWVYSKLHYLSKVRHIAFSICNDPPNRSLPFVDLLPQVDNKGYDELPYHEAFKEILPSDARIGELNDGRYVLSLNPHLESGKTLNEAYPDQPTAYHYKLPLPKIPAGTKASKVLRSPRPKIGVYCSSYNHRSDILFWNVQEWIRFLMGVKLYIPDAWFMVIGAPYDDRTIAVHRALKGAGDDAAGFFNQPIEFTLAMISQLDYLFAFPSGLGILADVLNTPAMMWFWGNLEGWEHVSGLFGSYADPAHTASGFHLMAPYDNPRESLDTWVDRGLPHVRNWPQ